VMRYDAESLHGEFGGHFRLVRVSRSRTKRHLEPSSNSSIATAESTRASPRCCGR
jgi:hypothetical protein